MVTVKSESEKLRNKCVLHLTVQDVYIISLGTVPSYLTLQVCLTYYNKAVMKLLAALNYSMVLIP